MINRQAPSVANIIENRLFHHFFQPVFSSYEQQIVGYECLIRSKFVQHPGILFDAAASENRLNDLDIQSMRVALHTIEKYYSNFQENSHFYLNVYPSTIMKDKYLTLLLQLFKETTVPLQKIILEINEEEHVKDLVDFSKTLHTLRRLEVKIALDDVGMGMAPFKRFLELQPDLIKIDRFFATNLAQSTFKQGIVQTIGDYCKSKNIMMILEGIEEEDDLHKAIDIGVTYAQGFLLGKPAPLQAILQC